MYNDYSKLSFVQVKIILFKILERRWTKKQKRNTFDDNYIIELNKIK